MLSQIRDSVEHVLEKAGQECELAIVLGSGLGAFADSVEGAVRIPYAEIPHFPPSTVAGHAGVLCTGKMHGRRVAVMQGRVHYYEGYSPDEVVFPVRVLKGIGAKTLMVTNAAGGVNEGFRPGDLMLISDHVNLMGFNPLCGKTAEHFGPRFPDMSFAYSEWLREAARAVAAAKGLKLREGVYLAVSGPSYETPAEIRAFRALGADAVGMSTVPEVVTARQMGMDVLGISCITNMAAGILKQALTHQEVMETTASIADTFTSLLSGVVRSI